MRASHRPFLHQPSLFFDLFFRCWFLRSDSWTDSTRGCFAHLIMDLLSHPDPELISNILERPNFIAHLTPHLKLDSAAQVSQVRLSMDCACVRMRVVCVIQLKFWMIVRQPTVVSFQDANAANLRISRTHTRARTPIFSYLHFGSRL